MSKKNIKQKNESEIKIDIQNQPKSAKIHKSDPLLEDFTCKLCSKVFITKDSLLNHEESVHTENVPLLANSLNLPYNRQ